MKDARIATDPARAGAAGCSARRARTVFALWIGASALVIACNEGDRKAPPSGSRSTAPWNELQVPGVELFLETEQASPYRSWGAARIDGASGTLHGKPAFEAVRARAASDPTTLTTLAMLFLDDGVAGRKPWTRPQGGSVPPEEDAIARPPVLSGDTLVYWRAHVQLADLVRCQASLASGEVTCALASQRIK